MCGRYASSRAPEDLAEEFEILEVRIPAALPPDYNVAPTKDVYAVVERASTPHDGDGTGGADEPGRAERRTPTRQLRTVRWGLVPSWADDARIGSRMINARMETVATKPAYRRAFAARRCLLPADGYYEWYPTSGTTKAGKPRKQPFFIRPRDGTSLAMAGLYEIWRDPARADDDPARFLWSCTVITTEAEDDLGRIHDRMPLMVDPDRWGQWLSPTTPADDVLALLEPAAPGRLEAFPVGAAVGNVRSNGPELVEPITLDAPDAAGADR